MAVMQSSSQNFISKLIQLGADVNVTSYTAYKCMEKAIRWRDIEFLQLLMDSGCDVNAQPSSEHLTALQMTVCQGRPHNISHHVCFVFIQYTTKYY